MEAPQQDQWARWLLHRRHGGDPEQQKAMLADLYHRRDAVLAHATVRQGDVLLGVGTGDGLIAFGAIPLIGQHGRVICSDISQDLLDHCRRIAMDMGVLDRCEFLVAAADDLTALPEVSIRQSGNPKIPTWEEVMKEALTPAEAAQFTAHLRPLVEIGQGMWRSAAAHLWAVK